MAFCWRADDGSTFNAGLAALRFFRGSGIVMLRNPSEGSGESAKHSLLDNWNTVSNFRVLANTMFIAN